MPKWQWIFRQLAGRLWLRASLFCAIGIASALLGFFLRDYLPSDISQQIGASAVDDILNIIASSMLAVTTFSLSVMVSAYTAAASSATPRATKLLLADQTSQNALSTFIGSFLFSLVGIIALKIDIYGDAGRLVLFIVTVAVVLFIILTLLRWIEYLSQLGRVGHTIDMVERAATQSVTSYCRQPYLGGTNIDDFKPAKKHTAVTHDSIGYIQYIDLAALSRVAQRIDKPVYLIVRPGSFNDSQRPLVYLELPKDKDEQDELSKMVQGAFTISGDRSFDQDPRYGLIVLSEIASRALSPAINDPGTAIDIIGTLVRVMAPLAQHDKDQEEEPRYPDVHVPAVEIADFFDDAFSGLARDGAPMVEVSIRLQKALYALSQMDGKEFSAQAKRLSHYSLALAEEALVHADDKKKLKSLEL